MLTTQHIERNYLGYCPRRASEVYSRRASSGRHGASCNPRRAPQLRGAADGLYPTKIGADLDQHVDLSWWTDK